MSNKGSAQPPPATPNTSFRRVTNRELSTGRLEPTRDVKSLLRLDHLRNLATWASGDASIPSLGAYLGNLYAATAETLAAEPHPSTVLCQRCETVLHPGLNCTVRIEKNGAKRKRKHEHASEQPCIWQNNVVYKCHFCSHKNWKRGTPKNHLKVLYPRKEKRPSKSQSSKSKNHMSASLNYSTCSKNDSISYVNGIALSATPGDNSISNNPANPSVTAGTPLLDAMKRKRNRSGAKKSRTPESNSAAGTSSVSRNRKRKQRKTMWENLKDKFEQNDRQGNQKGLNLRRPTLPNNQTLFLF
ncbi:hypothetical protein Tsubulata_008907 [Turnera subulata]|uniref:Uncharacterized protein n=1 Tax=Turnera subulata TaxID=218843 RepID=A0A9Q0FC76_9ROSI|nr:hypothetical protein Tsubulata_008907 [Turnera subulata]